VAALALPLEPVVPTNLLGQSVVAQDARSGQSVIEEVCWFDVAVDDVLPVGRVEGAEEAGKVGTQERQPARAVVTL